MEKHQWFDEFDKHLNYDKVPSGYFIDLLNTKTFPTISPFNLLLKLGSVEQNKRHHPEGNVFIHTMLVVDKAAELKENSKQPRIFMWAALLHDLGKIPATKVRRGKITAYDHDKLGKRMAYDFLRNCGCDEDFSTKVSLMVRWHMQAMFVVKDMPFKDLEGMTKDVDVDEMALLALSDRLGRGQTDESEITKEMDNIKIFLKKTKDYIGKNRKASV